MKSLFESLLLVFLSALVVMLAGCAAPATQEGMTVQGLALRKTQPYSVSVTTSGGEETEAVDSTNISSADFLAAIDSSIIQTNAFKNIAPGDGGEFRLNVAITQMRKSILAGNYTVDMETAWSLIKASDKSIALRKVIVSSYTSPSGETAGGTTKLRLAVEAAARNNIAQGLRTIAGLELDPVKAMALANSAKAPAPQVSGFNGSQQASYQTFLTKPLPRAFAISQNGGSGYAWGTDPGDKTLPADPKIRALFVCEKYARQACQLYMVDVEVVYRR